MEPPQVGKVKSNFASCGCLMLISIMVMVLSIGILPAYKEMKGRNIVVEEGVPVIDNIRSKVELFLDEHDYLPGVSTSDGKVVTNDCGYATSALRADDKSAAAIDNNAIQTMEVDDSSGKVNYFCGGCVLTNESEMANHVWSCIEMSASNLTGRRLRPEHMQYAAIMSSSNACYWVVACFGDGNGFPAGTGYAVAEFNDQANKRKFVATFENYKPESEKALVLDVSEKVPGNRYDMLKVGKVFLPTAEMLLTDYDNAIKAMEDFGWRFD